MNTKFSRTPVRRRVVAAMLSAAAVVGAVIVANSLAFFISSDFAEGSFGKIALYFAPATLCAFVLFAIAAWFGAFSRWYFALAVGVVVGVLAALLGTTISVALSGATFSGGLVGAIGATLGSSNLFFVAASAVAALTLGPAVVSAVLAFTTFTGTERRLALVRLPASNLDEGQVTHLKRKKIDLDLADEQWDAYLDALSDNGWTPVEVAPATSMPDSVFIEDTVVLFGRTAVITSPGAESRRGETADVELAVRELGLQVDRIVLPGTLDGGDVLKVGATVYVGRGGRTNAEGIRQLRAIVAPLGHTVVAVPISKVLHLKSAVTALPDGTVIGYPPLVDDVTVFDRFLAVPEESGAHVVVLAADTVLMAASAPRSAALIADLGYRVVTVDISEFEKLEGCVTCLSVRVR